MKHTIALVEGLEEIEGVVNDKLELRLVEGLLSRLLVQVEVTEPDLAGVLEDEGSLDSVKHLQTLRTRCYCPCSGPRGTCLGRCTSCRLLVLFKHLVDQHSQLLLVEELALRVVLVDFT